MSPRPGHSNDECLERKHAAASNCLAKPHKDSLGIVFLIALSVIAAVFYFVNTIYVYALKMLMWTFKKTKSVDVCDVL